MYTIIDAARNTAKIELENATLGEAVECAKRHAAAHPMPASWRIWSEDQILAEGALAAQ